MWNMTVRDLPLSDDQFFPATQIAMTSPATCSDNPAAVLRTLLSRFPAHLPSPT
jgi:hypothetical protein